MSSPRLYLISRPSLDLSGVDDLLQDLASTWKRGADSGDANLLVEFAGRICYLSFGARQSPKSTSEYLHHLVDQGHESVLEHANWSFVLMGVSRALTHQLVRHRAGFAFSQLSQQYHDERAATFVEPDSISSNPAASAIWEKAVENSRRVYKQLMEDLEASAVGIELPAKEVSRSIRSAARSVLPAATETVIAFTANARALRNFLTVRGPIVGDEEMRAVATALLEVMRVEAPDMFADFELVELSDGSMMVTKDERV